MTGCKFVSFLGALIATATTMSAGPGLAAPSALLQSQTQVQLLSYGTELFHPAISKSITDGTSTASVGTVGPFVSSSVVDSTYTANPFASLTYFFEVAGPLNVSVGVNAFGKLSDQVTAGTSSIADSFVEFYEIPGVQKVATVAECAVSGPCTGYNPAPAPISEIFSSPSNPVNNYSINFSVISNTTYEVLLGADVQVRGGSGSSFADPFISIDGAFNVDNPGYRLLISPEINQVSGVPELATWAMMSVGFGGLGGMMRMRRQQVSATV